MDAILSAEVSLDVTQSSTWTDTYVTCRGKGRERRGRDSNHIPPGRQTHPPARGAPPRYGHNKDSSETRTENPTRDESPAHSALRESSSAHSEPATAALGFRTLCARQGAQHARLCLRFQQLQPQDPLASPQPSARGCRRQDPQPEVALPRARGLKPVSYLNTSAFVTSPQGTFFFAAKRPVSGKRSHSDDPVPGPSCSGLLRGRVPRAPGQRRGGSGRTATGVPPRRGCSPARPEGPQL